MPVCVSFLFVFRVCVYRGIELQLLGHDLAKFTFEFQAGFGHRHDLDR